MLINKEYKNGFNSGLLHNSTDYLCIDNLRKAKTAINSDYDYIKNYWSGYLDAIKKLNISTNRS